MDDQLTRLIEGLEDLTEPGTGLLSGDGISVQQGWSIQRRLALAERLRASFAPAASTPSSGPPPSPSCGRRIRGSSSRRR